MAENILIVIPCLNEEHYLEKLVDQLTAETKSFSVKIIISDGGSTDRTLEIAQKLTQKYPQVATINNPKRIQAAAVNSAVATYGKESLYLIRIDAHADYPNNYCKTLIEEALRTKAASIVVAMKSVGVGLFQEAAAAAQNSILGNGGSYHRRLGNAGDWVDHGHHALIQISVFCELKGYDENFTHNEDAEFDTRLKKAGYKIWLTRMTYITYYPRDNAAALFNQYFFYGLGRAKNIIKHKSPPKLRQMGLIGVVPAALLAVFHSISHYLAWPILLWMILCSLFAIRLAVGKKDPFILIAGPVAMLMHTAWSLGFWKAVLMQFGSKEHENK